MIPVVDSLENALIQVNRDNAAVNALCERLQYLLSSDIHQAAAALDPRAKFSFTDHQRPSKEFVLSLHPCQHMHPLRLQVLVSLHHQLKEAPITGVL